MRYLRASFFAALVVLILLFWSGKAGAPATGPLLVEVSCPDLAVESAVFPGREERRSAVLGPSEAEEFGSIHVVVAPAEEEWLRGVDLVILKPREDGRPWDDALLDADSDGATRGRITEYGVVFAGLEPRSRYQLGILSSGKFYFEAQPTPFVNMCGDGSPQKVVFNRVYTGSSLDSSRVSGWIPVKAGTSTVTNLFAYEGSVIYGVVPEGDWDSVQVLLNRIDRAVHRTVGRVDDREFRFEGIPPFGRYDIKAYLRRGDEYLFASVGEILIADREERWVPLQLWGASDHASLSIDVESALPADRIPDFRVRVSGLATSPPVPFDVTLSLGQEVRLRGMIGAVVDDVKIFGDLSGFEVSPPQMLNGLGKRRYLGVFNKIKVRIRERRDPVVQNRLVKLVSPRGFEYSHDQIVKLRDGFGLSMGTMTWKPNQSGEMLAMDWTMVETCIVKSWAGSPSVNKASTRRARIEVGQNEVRIIDPGPPNGAGVRVR